MLTTTPTSDASARCFELSQRRPPAADLVEISARVVERQYEEIFPVVAHRYSSCRMGLGGLALLAFLTLLAANDR